MQPDPVRWLSAAQAAERLHYSHSHVLDLIRFGDLPAVKTGPYRNSQYRVTEAAVDAYLAARAAS